VKIRTLALGFVAQVGKYGMSYNWEIRDKKISGYCHVNGKGTITEFKQGI
jgi:hypothetical protein